MKKFIIAIFALFIINLGCKKLDDGSEPCACSPINNNFLSVSIKNDKNLDLLDSKTAGYFEIDKIQLYYNDASGNPKKINFNIRPVFSFGEGQFNYKTIVSEELVYLALSSNPTFYLKLGENTPYEIKPVFNTSKTKIDKLLINNNEALIEDGNVTKFMESNIFYLVR